MTSENGLERMTITVTNTNRASMWKRWITNNKIDLKKLTEQDEKNLECVARVCNRFGVDILDKQEIGNRQITSLFFARLAGEELLKHNPEPSADFYLALASQAYSMYEFAHKTIKSIDLKFS
jgi:hypothetical protein